MPRAKNKSNRGGRRQGQPGKAYKQRSDLNENRAQPIKTAPDQQYGKATEQAKSQASVPLPQMPTGAEMVSRPVASAPSGMQQPAPQPVSLSSLDAPTARPNEPITAGISQGPGPGPEVLTSSAGEDQQEWERLADYLPALELMANQPSSSVTTRNFVRKIRGSMPIASRNYLRGV